MQQETSPSTTTNTTEEITSRYIDFKLDFSFHHFFAKEGHLDLLRDFLNSVFEGHKVYSHDQYMLEKGKHEQAVEMALKLKARKMPPEEIAELTGLSEEEIESL